MTAHNGRVDRPPLARNERILVAETDRDGVPVVATTVAIYRRETPPAWTRLGWEQTLSVKWDSAEGVLNLRGLSSDVPAMRLAPARRSAIVPLARERVGATVLASTQVSLNGHGGALVTARRRFGSADAFWVVVLDGAVDPSDPTVRAAVAEAIRELRRCAGVPMP